MMSTDIAHRVASRFLKALGGGSDRDALLGKLEAAAHRGEEMLHTLAQQHKFWEKDILEQKPAHEVIKSVSKLEVLMKSYQREISDAMGFYEAVEEHEQGEHYAANKPV